MNKLLILSVLSAVVAACNPAQQHEVKTKEVITPKKEKEDMKEDYSEVDDQGSKMLVGEISENSFKNGNYPWYTSEKENFTVNTEMVNQFKKELQKYDIEVFMGTWCGDSQSQTPAFFKIMDAADFPQNKITMIAVDRNKRSPGGLENSRNIMYVPTFIFLKNGREAGRIVESPINSLEEDIRDIVSGNPQTPNYAQ